ncbi:hypothetical protein GCM10020358_52460 [Amorphoplanes nipponensis]|uniref:Uncharacterized protein n=1 Tax=Actinoplanes nipponensis TaxID=135950 RepID=A0A919MM91_9ACTN|nr:hypothetical protein Ani05nite_31460 [Actinoplanes nipponensis]
MVAGEEMWRRQQGHFPKGHDHYYQLGESASKRRHSHEEYEIRIWSDQMAVRDSEWNVSTTGAVTTADRMGPGELSD